MADMDTQGQKPSKHGRHKNRGPNKQKKLQSKPAQKRTPSAKELLLPRKTQVRHSNAPIPEVKQVQEPHPTCPLCGQVVENIAEAISTPEGRYAHFDCVVTQLKEQEHLLEGESISYVGSGNFAVVRKDEEGKYQIVRRIPYEQKDAFDAMKKYVEGTKA